MSKTEFAQAVYVAAIASGDDATEAFTKATEATAKYHDQLEASAQGKPGAPPGHTPLS